MEEFPIARVVSFVALGLVLIIVTSCGIEIVDQGNTGVKKVLGKVSDENLPSGLYFTNPLTTTIIELNNQVQRLEGTTEAYTKDVQKSDITLVINYSLAASASVRMYSEVGMEWAEKLIPQIINGSMKNTIGKWNAIELVANRTKAGQEIEDSIANSLKDRGILVSKMELTNIKFDAQFEQAVEDKVTAVQRAEQSKNQTIQVEEQAKQKIITAEADAQAMEIKTNALRQSQDLIFYEAVQKWNGVLPQYFMGDAIPLMNLGKVQ